MPYFHSTNELCPHNNTILPKKAVFVKGKARGILG